MALTNYSTSPAMSSSSRDTDDHGYLDMMPLAHSLPTVEERLCTYLTNLLQIPGLFSTLYEQDLKFELYFSQCLGHKVEK